MSRRSASDILPKTMAYSPTSAPFAEIEEGALNGSGFMSPPRIVVSSEPTYTAEPNVIGSENTRGVRSFARGVKGNSSASTSQTQRTRTLPAVTEASRSAVKDTTSLDRSNSVPEHDAANSSSPTDSVRSRVASPDSPAAARRRAAISQFLSRSTDVVSPEPSPISGEGDSIASETENTSVGSMVSTPSDDYTFLSSDQEKSVIDDSLIAAYLQMGENGFPAKVSLVPAAGSPTVVIVSSDAQEEPHRSSDASITDIAGQSLDSHEAVIVSSRPRVVSSNVTRGKLVPAPSSASSSPIYPSSNSPFAEAPTTPKSTPKSFHALVHDRVPSNQHQVSGQRSASAPFQTSPGFGDLADLLADAAMLEEHLSESPAPPRGTGPTPLYPIQESSIAYLQPSPLEENFPADAQAHHSEAQPMRRLADVSHELPTPPPKSPHRSRPLSAILGRRMSSTSQREKAPPVVHSAFPRNSMCSEMSSEESSVLVSRPSSFMYEPSDTDASSVRSSTRSWKMPKKSMSAFADRLWTKRESKHPRVVSSGTLSPILYTRIASLN